MLPIIRDNFMWYPIFADDIGLNELSNFLWIQNLIWGNFYPFSEFMTIGCCWVNFPNVYSPCKEWLRWCHGMKWHGWHVLQISMELALMVFSNMSRIVSFHSSPIIALSHYLPWQHVCIHMWPIAWLMNLFNYLLCFLGSYIKKMNSIIWSSVNNVISR